MFRLTESFSVQYKYNLVMIMAWYTQRLNKEHSQVHRLSVALWSIWDNLYNFNYINVSVNAVEVTVFRWRIIQSL